MIRWQTACVSEDACISPQPLWLVAIVPVDEN